MQPKRRLQRNPVAGDTQKLPIAAKIYKMSSAAALWNQRMVEGAAGAYATEYLADSCRASTHRMISSMLRPTLAGSAQQLHCHCFASTGHPALKESRFLACKTHIKERIRARIFS